MTIKAIVDDLAGVPEPLRDFYRAGTPDEKLDGKFVLKVEGANGWALENVDGLKSAVSAERGRAQQLEARVKAFGDYDPAKLSKDLEDLTRLRSIDPAKEADKLAEAKAQSKIEQITAAHAAELAKHKETAEKAMRGLQTRTVQAAINDALAKADVLNPEALRLKLERHVRLRETGDDNDPFSVEVIGPDGNPLVDGQARPLSLDAFTSDLRKDPTWATSFKPAGKAGAGAGGGAAGGGSKIMSRSQFEQLAPNEKMTVVQSGVQITD